MTKIWQTNLLDYMSFPYTCKNIVLDSVTTNAYGNQSAFYCSKHMDYRIIEEECMGMSCDACEIRDIKEYEKMLVKVIE